MIESERWVTLSALGAAMFAVGFSCAGVACSARDADLAEATRTQPSATVAISASAVASATSATSATSAAIAPTAASAASAAGAAKGPDTTAHDGLKVKRFVVTSKINAREPSAGDEFRLGSAPIYAFVELENSAAEARDIRVVFQNRETQASVGHVKLTVPGAQARFRTWGNTRLIQDPGAWVAIVSTSDGTELGRADFDVKS